jgi:hypothetical protein
MSESLPIQLELICVDFPNPDDYPDWYFGFVERKAVVRRVKLEEAHEQETLTFSTELSVKIDEDGKQVVFYGPAAQGPPGDRFVYLNWQRKIGAGWENLSRIKVPLGIFSYEDVKTAIKAQKPLHLQVHVRDAKGKPAAATLKAEALQVLA